jgi:hypothetical protein
MSAICYFTGAICYFTGLLTIATAGIAGRVLLFVTGKGYILLSADSFFFSR